VTCHDHQDTRLGCGRGISTGQLQLPQLRGRAPQCARPRVAAASADGQSWILLNASPDLRQQIAAAPELWPRPGNPTRSSPIKAVVLSNSDVDHVAGLLSLREGFAFTLYASARWENWKHPQTGEWLRTFCIITTTANELVSQIHDRMPVIIPTDDYERWLANIEPDPRDLLVPYPSGLMKMWPISTRVNKPENDDADLLTPIPEP
jgi:hypothetical protein